MRKREQANRAAEPVEEPEACDQGEKYDPEGVHCLLGSGAEAPFVVLQYMSRLKPRPAKPRRNALCGNVRGSEGLSQSIVTVVGI